LRFSFCRMIWFWFRSAGALLETTKAHAAESRNIFFNLILVQYF
jgi:hypothetical protein